jgi:hypothetical protein
VAYLLGNLALAMGLQGAEFLRGPITLWRRGLFFLAAGCLMFPATWVVDVAGLGLMVAAWGGSFLPRASR